MIYSRCLYFSVSKGFLCRRAIFCYLLIISSRIKHLHHYIVTYLLFWTQGSRQKRATRELQGCHQLVPQSRQSQNRKRRETGVIAAPTDFPSSARKHLAHRRWRKLPVFCLILCSCSSRSISSEEVTDMVVGMNETEKGERSFRSRSPVLGCLLWVILLEQGLGQGDQPPGLPPSITHPQGCSCCWCPLSFSRDCKL